MANQPTTALSLSLVLIRLLRCNVCPMCGSRKDQGRCFCTSCYFAVPVPMRNKLYTRMDAGKGEFEEAYLAAMSELKRKGFARQIDQWSPEAASTVIATGFIQAIQQLQAAREKKA